MAHLHFADKSQSFRNTRHEINTFFKDKLMVKLFKLNIGLICLQWILFGVFLVYLPPELPLLYSKPWGVDQLVNKYYLSILPASSTILLIIDFLISSWMIKKSVLVSKIMMWSMVVANILASIAVVKMVQLLG